MKVLQQVHATCVFFRFVLFLLCFLFFFVFSLSSIFETQFATSIFFYLFIFHVFRKLMDILQSLIRYKKKQIYKIDKVDFILIQNNENVSMFYIFLNIAPQKKSALGG